MSIHRAKNTAIADIKYLRLHTCRFTLPPKGPDGPSAVGGILNPPVLEFELMKKNPSTYNKFKTHQFILV